jgi:hypothetical protein
MKSYYLLALFIIGMFITSADAQLVGNDITQTELKEMMQKAFKEKVMNWQLYGSRKNYIVEFYYDAANIVYPPGGSAIVAVKTVFRDDNGINELKRVRKHNLKTTGINPEELKYDNFAYTYETIEIYCNIKKIKTVDPILDFDKGSNILNIVPSAQGVAFNIYDNSIDEKLYDIVCPKNASNKIESVIYKYGTRALEIKGTLIEQKKIIIEINWEKIIEEDINLTADKPFTVLKGKYDQKQLLANCRYAENVSTTKCTITLGSDEIAQLIFK